MSKIHFTVHVDDIGCTATLAVDIDDQPEYLRQFESRGEAVSQAVMEAAEKLGVQLQAEYATRDIILKRVAAIGTSQESLP